MSKKLDNCPLCKSPVIMHTSIENDGVYLHLTPAAEAEIERLKAENEKLKAVLLAFCEWDIDYPIGTNVNAGLEQMNAILAYAGELIGFDKPHYIGKRGRDYVAELKGSNI